MARSRRYTEVNPLADTRNGKSGKPRAEIVKSTAVLKDFPDHGLLIERVLSAACDEIGAT